MYANIFHFVKDIKGQTENDKMGKVLLFYTLKEIAVNKVSQRSISEVQLL